MNRLHVLLYVCIAPLAFADQGSFRNSGGSGAVGAGVYVTSNVGTPAGTLTLNCPTVSTGACAGGSFNFASNDGTTLIDAAFTSGTYVESCSGGGKGGHITCGYTFAASFTGTLTLNGLPQAITGVTYQGFETGGKPATGTTAYTSAYTPFYYSDSEQIHRSDDLLGTNQISYGSGGGGVGQFYGAYGIALDSARRIYIADTYNCRIVRIDDMNGTNWTAYGGTCGSGQGQFYDPSGIAVDSAGKIYVLDTGNCRVVRIDDMTGANWAAYGTVGSGVGQFAQYITSLAVDAASRIYVADTGNKRVVRMDDLSGTNWTSLTQSVPVNGASYTLQSPAAVALDSVGRIYIGDNESYQPAVVRVDDMTGANWTYLFIGSGSGINSIAIDPSGTVFTGGGGAHLVVNMTAVLNSSSAIGPIGSYYVFGVTPIPLPSPPPSAISLLPTMLSFSQNAGTTSPSQPVTIFNFGGAPLNLGNISANGGFAETNNCPNQLVGGASCTASVTFAPSTTGPASGLLTVNDDSSNLGTSQSVPLTGLGTAPAASVFPHSMSFTEVLGGTSATKNVTLRNTGNGPLQVMNVVATGPFTPTNNCTAIAPATSCTIQVSFTPIALGAASGTLTITDNAGAQTVSLSGNGSAPVTFFPNTVNFFTVAVGTTSATKTITLKNHLSVGLTFTGMTTSPGFAIASSTCGASIGAKATCTINVTFSPLAAGSVTGALTVSDTAATSPQTVTLKGVGK